MYFHSNQTLYNPIPIGAQLDLIIYGKYFISSMLVVVTGMQEVYFCNFRPLMTNTIVMYNIMWPALVHFFFPLIIISKKKLSSLIDDACFLSFWQTQIFFSNPLVDFWFSFYIICGCLVSDLYIRTCRLHCLYNFLFSVKQVTIPDFMMLAKSAPPLFYFSSYLLSWEAMH